MPKVPVHDEGAAKEDDVGSLFEETHPHLKEFNRFLYELSKESNRGAVLICVSLLDDLLLRTIQAFLIESDPTNKLLKGFNAPLGTFGTRAAAAFAMGLISQAEFNECETIRKIRNLFAHGVHTSFDDEKVQQLCSRLQMSAKPYGDVDVNAYGTFATSAVALILNLTNRPHYVAKKRLKHGEWAY